ncbi:uncharacterized protein LOC117344863 isoform X3 [Pecten maximus]|uniref:uncharacterized protein LOC117344863 isoform X3 n=1 Tax=Pecten maximus TaxID=6579 RepID=UPI001458B22C|nr:uncharacterized protein LOC117344863 isoform X3 [Pecten maximus]
MADLKGQGSPGHSENFHRVQNNGSEPCGQDPTIPSDNNEYSYMLFEHDPDLIVEIDIPLDDGPVVNGHSREPTSIRSNKSVGFSGRKTSSKIKQHSSVKTRGRPIKSHEMEPFLSVDNLPPEKQTSRTCTANSGSSKSHRKIKSSPGPENRSSLSGRSPYGSPAFFLRPSGEIGKHARVPDRKGVKLRNGRLTPGSSVFITPEDSLKKVNHCIKNPFKHSINYTTDDLNIEKGKSPDHCKTPSGEMKQRTTFATFHMGKVLAKSNTESPNKKQGKLLKGKLQPLKPVALGGGPTIKQCRGIVAETKSYGAPPNRTLARRREIVQQVPNIHEYLYERPHTVESIHRTSEASSVDENRDNNVKVDFSELDLADRLDRSTPTPTDRDVPVVPPASAASMERRKQGNVSPDPRVFATEISTGRTVPEITEEIQVEELHNKLNLQNSSSNAKTGDSPQSKNADSDTGLVNEQSPVLSRPQTAVSGQSHSQSADSSSRPHTAGQLQSRPQTASKSVRFAEDPTNPTNKRKEKSGKETCKPTDLGNGVKRDEDPDHKDGPSGQRPGQGEIRLISAGSAGQSSAENDKKASSSKSDNQGKQQSLKYFQSDRHENKQAVCSRYDKGKDCRKPSTLQVQAVGHGGQVHTLICPESPSNRSRSPSPQRRGQRSPSPQQRGPGSLITNQKQQSKHNKSNRLVRPSSANMSTRQLTSSRSRKSSNTKVCFEDDKPQHESIFVQKGEGDELYVGIREDRTLTFEDIEAELRALQEDIQERRVTEEHWDVLQDDSSEDGSDVSTVVEDRINQSDDNLLGLSQSEEDLLADIRGDEVVVDEAVVDEDVQQDCWGDYSSLLDIYRRKCMDVSENCGQISNKLTTPRRSKVKRRCHSAGRDSLTSDSLKRKGSCQSVYTLDSGKGESCEGTTRDDSAVGLSHATSNLTLDSGLGNSEINDQPHLDNIKEVKNSCVMDGQVLSGPGEQSMKEMVPPLVLHSAPQVEPQETELVEDVDEDQTVVDTKKLLEIVCDELVTHQEKLKEDADMPPIPKVEPVPPKEDLKIVAEVKTLNKQKKKKQARSGPIAPFAPVCFEVNARPPKGYLYYFAYGTEMSLSRLTTYIKREPQRYWGLLFGFQLVFNKKGADLEAGGFANIEFNPYSSVEGCVYPITQQELLLLDKHVGYPQHYEHLVTPLWLMNSHEDPNEYGVAQYCVPALTFIAQDRWIETEEKLDYSGSLSQCIKNSDIVTPGYHDHLTNLATVNSGREQIAAA